MTTSSATETRERIFRTAIDRIRDEGYESVSVSRITRDAGVAKGTFFNHFPTKDHLLAELFHRTVNGALGDVSGLRLAGTDAVLAFAHALIAHLARDRTLAEALVIRLSSLPAPAPSVERAHTTAMETGPAAERGAKLDSGSSPAPDPIRDEERIRRWIEARLGESIPIAVPLVPAEIEVLAFTVAWCLHGTLDEWARGTERPETLHDTAERRIVFLFESSGFPATRGGPRPDPHDPTTTGS